MKHNIFTIYDSKAKAYLTPFFLHQDGMALRVFADCINDATHQFGKHPEDYTLFNIGSWSDDKAKFLTNNPISIATGIELKTFQDLSEMKEFNEEQQKLFTDPPIGDLKEVK